MSFLPQLQSLSHYVPINRRQALLGLSLAALTACSRSLESSAKTSGVSYYTCPMHPSVHSQDAHGKCPICGMDLVPVMTSGATNPATPVASTASNPAPDASLTSADNGMVTVPEERLQAIGVTNEVVSRRVLSRPIQAPARVEVDESGLRDINVKAGAGYVEKLYANYEGATVRKGQPLMRVLCEGWLAAQTDYIHAYRALRRTPTMSPNNSFALDNQLALMRARIRVWDLSKEQIAGLEKFAISTDEIDLRTGHGLSGSFDLLAPFDGHVHQKKAMEGMRFEPGQSLLVLAALDRMWVVAEFAEDQAQYLDLGQKLTVTFPSMPQHQFTAAVDFIYPHIQEDDRRLRVRLIVPNEGDMLHPGLFANVTGQVSVGERLSISVESVVPTGDRYVVFLDHGGGKLEPREIKVGQQIGNHYEVLSGLQEGDRIISSANFLIDAESRLQGVLKSWSNHP